MLTATALRRHFLARMRTREPSVSSAEFQLWRCDSSRFHGRSEEAAFVGFHRVP